MSVTNLSFCGNWELNSGYSPPNITTSTSLYRTKSKEPTIILNIDGYDGCITVGDFILDLSALHTSPRH